MGRTARLPVCKLLSDSQTGEMEVKWSERNCKGYLVRQVLTLNIVCGFYFSSSSSSFFLLLNDINVKYILNSTAVEIKQFINIQGKSLPKKADR